MSNAVNEIITNADYLVLLLFRVGGLIFSSPVFGRKNIPNRAKIGLVAIISYLFFTIFPQQAAIEYSTLGGYFIVCAGELLLGIALAFVTNIFFSLTFVAGQLIDMQIGFGIVNVYDPQNNSQIPMMGNLLNIILLIVFFGANGHLRLIQIIHLTIEKMPVGALAFSPGLALAAVEVFAMSFMLGVMVAMPVIASGLILEIAFGALIRTVPQMNMFVVGMPIKVLVGFVVVMFTLPAFIGFSDRIFSEMFLGIEKLFGTFAVVS